jgi:hypothetical protein
MVWPLASNSGEGKKKLWREEGGEAAWSGLWPQLVDKVKKLRREKYDAVERLHGITSDLKGLERDLRRLKAEKRRGHK